MCSIVYFSVSFAEKLISKSIFYLKKKHIYRYCICKDFHAIPPLDGCTYEGIDSGSQPNQVK